MNFYLYLAIAAWLIFLIAFGLNRSRYRNTLLLFIALVLTVPAVSLMFDNSLAILTIIIMVTAFAIMIVPFFLTINGIQMIKREGLGLSTVLSLGLGIVIGLGELATFAIFFGGSFLEYESEAYQTLEKMAWPMAILSITVIYGSVVFLMFMFYTLFLQIIPPRRDFDYVIIHGAGLLDGNRVSKLLSDRLDKAITVYRKDPTPPIMIPSGGKGSDESVSEARAMADYLLEHGIPGDHIILEDKSTTTLENLQNSKEIIDSREGDKYIALVTSNYHVYRALRYCNKIGLKCTGIGSHVAFYYWPSALIREFIAIHAEKKHIILFIIGWLLSLIPLAVLALSLAG